MQSAFDKIFEFFSHHNLEFDKFSHKCPLLCVDVCRSDTFDEGDDACSIKSHLLCFPVPVSNVDIVRHFADVILVEVPSVLKGVLTADCNFSRLSKNH